MNTQLPSSTDCRKSFKARGHKCQLQIHKEFEECGKANEHIASWKRKKGSLDEEPEPKQQLLV
jgi:hypothetical protein